jgi:flavin reductase (DIM6/NTAB) family NADH-FMN oxidoreductase RutF
MSEPIGPELFRGVMRRWTSGVTVATLRVGEEVRGITMSSFISVSLDPPLVLISIDKRARSHELAVRAGRYCVHLLAEDQRLLSDRFAGRRPGEHARFDDCSSRTTPTGEPILDGCLGFFDCRVVAVHDAGDHTLFIGQIESGEVGPPKAPLVFFDARYRRLAPPNPLEEAELIPTELLFAWSSL